MKKIMSIVIILLLLGASMQEVNSKTSENLNSQRRYLYDLNSGDCVLWGYVGRYMDKGDWAYEAYALLDGSISPIGFKCAGVSYTPSTSGTKIVSVTRGPYDHKVVARHIGTLAQGAFGFPIYSIPVNTQNTYWFSVGI